MQTDIPVRPAAPEPAAATAEPMPPPSDLHYQLVTLAEAVRGLSRSQQTLLDTLARRAPHPPPPPATVVGDPGDGLRPSAVIDYARLSTVQQIAVGLRGATPQGPRALASRAAPATGPAEEPDVAPAGAD